MKCFPPRRADAHKQQQQQQEQEQEQEQQENSEKSSDPVKNASVLADQDQRKVLKFGFSSKVSISKVLTVSNRISRSK